MSLLRDGSFFAASMAHLAVDLINGQVGLLLAVLSGPLALTNTTIGQVSTVYQLVGSLSQPLFGLLADRWGARLVVVSGVLWIALNFGLAVMLGGYLALVFLVLGSFGSAAFHPAGTMQASRRGQDLFRGRETTATAVFFMFGQTGISLAPAISGAVLDLWGWSGLSVFLLIVVPVGLNAARKIDPGAPSPSVVRPDAQQGSGAGWLAFVIFMLVVALRSMSQVSIMTFLPKFFLDSGYGAARIGALTAFFMGGSAIGGLLGGWLGDRFSKRIVIAATLAPAALPLWLIPVTATAIWSIPIVAISGLLSGASFSILVVLAQRMMPSRLAAASGMVLGFMFASGSLGALLSGVLADRYTLGLVFQLAAVSALLAGGLSLALKRLDG